MDYGLKGGRSQDWDAFGALLSNYFSKPIFQQLPEAGGFGALQSKPVQVTNPRANSAQTPFAGLQYLTPEIAHGAAEVVVPFYEMATNKQARTLGYGALEAMGPLGDLAAYGKVMSPAMVAFHGSPHKFDKFRMDKIGTGEGAQVYGHGLYFAEHPDTAKHYLPAPGNRENNVYFAGELMPEPWGDIRRRFGDSPAADAIAQLRSYGSVDEAIESARHTASVVGNPKHLRTAEWLEANRDNLEIAPRDGGGQNLYEVDIPDSAVEKMLDWDAPLSEQPELLSALRELAETPFEKSLYYKQAKDRYLFSTMEDVAAHRQVYEARRRILRDSLQDFELKNSNGMTAYLSLQRLDLMQEQQGASEMLRELGIPGIKYFDGSSRAKGEGTRNLVLFDENLVTVLSRNGEPVLKEGK